MANPLGPEELREFEKLTEELDRERTSARGTVILTASYVETLLEKLLRAGLVEARAVEALFEGQGSLATFSARIDMSFAVGLISEPRRRDLHVLRKIRNHFAHEVAPGTFEEDPVRSLIRNFSGFEFWDAIASGRGRKLNRPVSFELLFNGIAVVLIGFLEGDIKKARHPKSPVERPLTPPSAEEVGRLMERREREKE